MANIYKRLSIVLFSLINTAFYCYATLTDGYTDKLSYRAGEVITFYTKSTDTDYFLYAIDGTPTYTLSGFNSNSQLGLPPANSYSVGFGYASTYTWTVPGSMKSGLYLLGSTAPGIIPIIIKGDKGTSSSSPGANVVVVYPTNTDAAYTSSGGSSFYGASPTQIASFFRPWQRQTTDAPDGFLKWLYGTSTYTVNVIADKDMEDYSEIQYAKLLIVIGHSEYWTRQARVHFDQFVDAGKDAMILSGNTMYWQVRYYNDSINGTPQLVCYKNVAEPGSGYHYYECDPLLYTSEWAFDPNHTLQYSPLGSIGVSAKYVAYPFTDNFGGHKILLPTSPLLSGVSSSTISISNPHEYDGTLVKSTFDGNGDPYLDLTSLGFYRAELIGYNKITDTNTPYPNYYCPFMVFQKTCSSGKTINVSSTNWCHTDNFNSNSDIIQKITKTGMDNLLSGGAIWTNTVTPSSFRLSVPANTHGTSISFNACQNNGSVNITPCGVVIDNDNTRKIEYSYGDYRANIINCSTCSHSAKLSNNGSTKDGSSDSLLTTPDYINIFPNPSSGVFILEIGNDSSAEVSVTNLLGEIIYAEKIKQARRAGININSKPGIYFVQVRNNEKIYSKKLLIY